MDDHRPVRFGFTVKLLGALLAAVALVLLITLLVVRQQTDAQVRAATTRMIEQSRHAFREMEAVQRLEIARVGRAFTSSPRTLAALEAALEGGDTDWLAETARYELALNVLPQSLAAFTDETGTPVVTLIDGGPLTGDAAHLRPLAARLIAEPGAERLAYRVVDGRLYLLQLQPLDFDGHLIGTIAFGLPVDNDDADELGSMLGADLCYVAADRCLAGTAAADPALQRLLIEHARRGRSAVVERSDGRWLLITDAIPGAAPIATSRVMAVPIEHMLAPFAEIQRALHLTGAGALVLALLLSVLLSRGLTRPVRELVTATVRVRHGDYSARVPVATRDELGVLGEAFNAMTEGLLLKERYRGVLDKVVSPQVAEDLMKGELELGGETREVTTLFADITAFSELVDGMAPQQAIALLNQCMARLEAIVQAHNGVVDKYIGDEIMVIFGAPIARTDDVANAVEAALDMQQAMREWNAERQHRGESPVSLSIGVHTGEVVAGNMGSPNRLNYTVVGDAVNLSKRLCGAAGPGMVLLTESTWNRLDPGTIDGVSARPLGPRSFKGFADRQRIVAVERGDGSESHGPIRGARSSHESTRNSEPPMSDVDSPVEADGGRRAARTASPPTRSGSRRVAALLLAGAMATAAAAPIHAQSGGLPTLERLGLHYSSPAGAVQLALSGRLDLEAFAPGDDPTWLIPTTDAFFAGRARLFADLFVGDRVYGLVELRADRGHAPGDSRLDARVEQAFLRFRPFTRSAIAIAIQAGKFASPFGAYAARHGTEADPLIRPPLPYDHRTLVTATVAPDGLDGFLDWRSEARERRPDGSPVVWDVPYPWGALATFGAGRLGVRFGLLGSAPSGDPETWTLAGRRLRHPNVMAGVAYRIAPDLTFGAAWNRGPYLEPLESGTLPEGAALEDFVQETVAFDAVFERGRTSVRAELFLNRWEVPNLTGDPLDTSFYVEGTTRLAAGLFIAARYGEIRFSRMGPGATATGADAGGRGRFDSDRLRADAGAQPRGLRRRWDMNQQRLQLGGGYRILHNVEIRAEYLINRTSGAADPDDNLLSAQLWWAF